MTRYVFEEVKQHASKAGACHGCGLVTKRQKTFTNTINPWNKNEDGTPRSREQIREKLLAEAAEWEAQPVYHVRCEP